MPMKSKAQRAYLWANEPEVAHKFEKETPKDAKMPKRIGKKKHPKKKSFLLKA